MGGSFSHITSGPAGSGHGQFIGVRLLDHLGDAHEALEECYGMIWVLAHGAAPTHLPPDETVEWARQHYRAGLDLSPGMFPSDQPLPGDGT